MDFEIVVQRETSSAFCTIGSMNMGGKYKCLTLEDVVREVVGQPVKAWKVDKKTAIPRGRYQVIIDYSNRFKKKLPLLLNVPGFEGVRIHGGNNADNTEGCILVGDTRGNNSIGGAIANGVMGKVQAVIQQELDHGNKVWLTIR